MYESESLLPHSARDLTQVTEQLHSKRCKDEKQEHEEKTQIAHLQEKKRNK